MGRDKKHLHAVIVVAEGDQECDRERPRTHEYTNSTPSRGTLGIPVSFLHHERKSERA
jgi:hypothetical protein